MISLAAAANLGRIKLGMRALQRMPRWPMPDIHGVTVYTKRPLPREARYLQWEPDAEGHYTWINRGQLYLDRAVHTTRTLDEFYRWFRENPALARYIARTQAEALRWTRTRYDLWEDKDDRNSE